MKNIIVFSHNCFSDTSNNGKTLASIFSKINPLRVSQIFISDREMPASHERCNSFYKISDRDLISSLIRKSEFGCEVTIENKASAVQTGKPNAIKRSPFTIWLRDIFWVVLFPLKYKALFDWIKFKSPDLLFYVSGDAIFSMKIALRIAKHFNLPLVVYVTDDYYVFNRPNKSSFFDYTHCMWLRRQFKKLLKSSSRCYVIGEKMKSVYDDEFGINSNILINTIPITTFDPISSCSTESIKLGYFGNISLGRGVQLLKLAELIKEATCKLGAKIELHIYTFSELSEELRSSLSSFRVHLHPGVGAMKLKAVMQSCDFLVLVESPERKNLKLTALSLSTKVPEYMMMSRPILAFGPIEAGSINFIVKHNCGVYIDSEDSANINVEKLCEIVSNKSLQFNLAEYAHQFACKYFNQETQSEQFAYDINNIQKQ